MRPFLKWLGNKYRLIETIQPFIPKGNRLIEPFTGSGAVFLNTDFKRYILAEQNKDLVNLYLSLQNEQEAFIKYCKRLFQPRHNIKEKFYHYRERFNHSSEPRERAALFVYLNRHCYNGLCRYNSKGEFNAPFGRYDKPYFPDKEMHYFAKKLKSAKILHGDYLDTLKKAKVGDVIYCDPPYVPLSKSANFTAYTKTQFGENEQITLANKAKELANQGIPVIISNHDTEFTRHHYQDAKLHSFPIRRTISCKGEKREHVKELVALFD